MEKVYYVTIVDPTDGPKVTTIICDERKKYTDVITKQLGGVHNLESQKTGDFISGKQKKGNKLYSVIITNK